MNIHLDAAAEQFLDRLSETTRRMERAQREISSGKRITAVSDDPDQISTLLQTRLELERTEHNQKNLNRFQTEVDTAEAALNSAESIMERARALAAQGATDTATPEARASIADQVSALLERMTGIANTTVEGRFIFSGDNDGQPAFVFDSTVSPAPYGAYLGSSSSREAVAADGSRFSVAKSAAGIFTDPSADVLAALDGLQHALRAGDTDTIAAAAAVVLDAGEHLRKQHAWYGSVQARIKDALDASSSRIVRLQTQVGAIEDADLTASIVQFQQAKLQREAALQAHAQIPRKTLFDYLG